MKLRLFRRATKPSRTALAVAGVLIGVAVAGGSVLANPGGSINACRHKTTGAIRWVENYGDCKTTEIAMSWSEGGEGVPGKDGLPGATGPIGPAGADGVDGVDGRDGADGVDGATGATGPQGPSGADGLGSLDALRGTPCNVGTPNEGTLEVTYTPNGAVDGVTVGCRRNNVARVVSVHLRALAYTYCYENPGGFGSGCDTVSSRGGVSSSPVGLSCSIESFSSSANGDQGLRTSSCSREFSADDEVTITATLERGARITWTGCPNLVTPQSCRIAAGASNQSITVQFS